MRRLLSGVTLFLVFCSAYAQSALQGGTSSAPPETEDVTWILVVVFIFFGMVLYFTWRLIAGERKRNLEKKQPE